MSNETVLGAVCFVYISSIPVLLQLSLHLHNLFVFAAGTAGCSLGSLLCILQVTRPVAFV